MINYKLYESQTSVNRHVTAFSQTNERMLANGDTESKLNIRSRRIIAVECTG